MNNYRRYNPLIDEWIIVAANRINRPWGGAQSKRDTDEENRSNQKNSLAPGGVRTRGNVTPEYTSTYVFDNDFPSFTEFETCAVQPEDSDLFKQHEVRGVCRVICYHPSSSLTLATMTHQDVLAVIGVWREQYTDLEGKYTWVQVFENRGAVVGCSNMHPHGQLWASNYLPTIPQKKWAAQKKYFEKHGTPLLVDYLTQEVSRNERIVIRNSHWTVLVPYWAFWPFEVMLLPNRHVARFVELNEAESASLAEILRKILVKYDNIFECSFPYMLGWYSAPSGGEYADVTPWQLHCSIFPPLLRSATVPKYIAGYEVFAEKQRDMTPEAAAAKLREMSDVHYSCK